MFQYSDLDDVQYIYECGKRNLPIFYNFSQLTHMAYNDKFIVCHAQKSNKIIGYLIGEREYGEDCSRNKYNFHILSFAIDKKYRKQGIGKSLIQFVAKKLKKEKKKTITLNVHAENTGAIAFYEKCGFTKKHTLENYYWGSSFKCKDAFHMKNKITSIIIK